MEYKNTPTVDNGKDIAGKELKIVDMINDKSEKYLHELLCEKVAYDLMLWLKYYRIGTTSYLRETSSALYFIDLNDSTMDKVIIKSKNILINKYGITVVSDNPLILSSLVPFDELVEDIL